MIKVALLLSIFGGYRRKDHVNLLINHKEDRGSVVIVNIPETKTDKKGVLSIIEENEMNSLKLICVVVTTGMFREKILLELQAMSLYCAACWKKHIWEDSKNNCKISGIDGHRKVYRKVLCNRLVNAGTNMTTMKQRGWWKSNNSCQRMFRR